MTQPDPTTAPPDPIIVTPRRAANDVLLAVRALSDALDRMNGEMKLGMDMNATDLAALRMLIVREQLGQSVSPHEMARHLRISTASTTKLLDRLSVAGHVERHPHPHDRRARVVVLTDHSRREFLRHLAQRLEAMRAVTDGYDDGALRVSARFIEEVARAVDPS
jgi:DNA-binding MarR family transcriptional regulator